MTAQTSKPIAGPALPWQDKPAAAAAKPKGKPAAKASAKKPAKPVAKPKAAVSKPKVATSKPAASRSVKPAAKVAAKPVVKSAAKPASKPASPSKAPTKKPLAKAAPKTAVKAPAKPVAKPAAKAASQAVPAKVNKPLAKTPVKAVVPAPAPKPVKAPAVKAAVTAPPVVQVPPPAPEPQIRKTRGRSAAHALPAPAPVVPTHAPDAAKASYMLVPERVTAPPPQVAVIRKDPKLANNWKNKPPEQLSDEEVMAMPDSEYMNDVQLAFFRHKLVRLKHDIHSNAGETTEHLREDTVVVPDPADRATIEEEHALELRTRDRERKLLKKIEQSIARIDAGDYGYCDETGEPIGVGRLIARPTASLSLEAQQRRELRQKMFGD